MSHTLARVPPLYVVWNCTLIHRLQITVIILGTIVFAVYNATAKLNQWRHLALSSELTSSSVAIGQSPLYTGQSEA